MKAKNRKKLATIKGRVLNTIFANMANRAKGEDDPDYADALKLLGDAMKEIEARYGQVE